MTTQRIRITTKDLIAVIEKDKAEAIAERKLWVVEQTARNAKDQRDTLVWARKLALALLKDVEAVEKGKKPTAVEKLYKTAGRGRYLRELPTLSLQSVPKLDTSTSGWDRDIALLKLSTDDTILIGTNSQFSRYFR